MTNADGRLLDVIFPQAKEGDDWGRKLVAALQKFQRQKVRPRCITKVYTAPLEIDAGACNVFKTTTVNSVGNSTFNLASSSFVDWLVLIITNDATSGKTITFGTGFKPTGTLVGTASKSATLLFVSDGSNFFEVARTTGIS